MLRHFRNQRKILSIFLWIVIASFIGTIFLVWGVGGKGNQKTYALKINDHVVSFNEYKTTYENISNTYRQLFGSNIDQKILSRQVIEEIISKYLLLDEANRLKLPVTDAEILEEIKKVPAFQVNGQFDKNRYLEVLRLNHITPDAFENDIRVNLLLNKIKGLIATSIYVNDQEILKEYRMRNKAAEISYIKVSPEDFEKDVKFDDKTIEKYYLENKNEFLEPVKVKLKYVEFTPDNVKIDDNISEQELQSYYLKNKEKFKQDEQIKARHILIKIDNFQDNSSVEKALKKAEEIYKKARSGGKFEELAKQYSDDISKNNGGDLGFIKRGMMIKEFEDSLFSLKEGEISKPVKTSFGYHIIKNEKYLPKKEYTFQEVRDQIRATILKDKIMAQFKQTVQTKYKEIQSFGNLSGYIAKNPKALEIKEIGYLSEGVNNIFIPQDIKNELLKMDKTELSPLFLINGKYYLFEVADKIAPTVPPLEKIKDKVIKSYIQKQSSIIAKKKADEAADKSSINEAAKFLNLAPQDVAAFKRIDPIPNIGVNSTMTEAIFTTKAPSMVRKSIQHGNSYYVIYVKNFIPASDDKLPEQRNTIAQYLINLKQTEAYNSYIDRLKKDARIDISPNLLD
ncbi:SurA N-terminal domain-containing protein [Calditerrivibrio sp.]|uniref:peptidylprolyl isomerase n=1 Tax=Calditerrivibrio sp. TaxID=2792612 RepID=UPI003D0AE1D9